MTNSAIYQEYLQFPGLQLCPIIPIFPIFLRQSYIFLYFAGNVLYVLFFQIEPAKFLIICVFCESLLMKTLLRMNVARQTVDWT